MNWYKISQADRHPVMLDFPPVKQATAFTCGPAVLESALAYYGFDISEHRLAAELNTTFENGTEHDEIAKLIKELGLRLELRSMSAQDLIEFINRKIPVILLLQAWAKEKTVQKDLDYGSHIKSPHYVVAIGYDRSGIYFQDPWLTNRGFLSFQELNERWHAADRNKKILRRLGIAIYGIEPQYSSDKVIPIR